MIIISVVRISVVMIFGLSLNYFVRVLMINVIKVIVNFVRG